MNDSISRQAAIDAMRKYEVDIPQYAPREVDIFWDDAIDACCDAVEALPSAKSDPDAEFWENRAAEYSKIIASLVADMSKGINFGSMQIAETGKIIFGKAESIIRCKDCKHQEKFFHTDGRRKSGGYYIYGCDFAEGYSHVCLDDDFCSRAERRQDD